jgi:hypothetical protein
LTFNKLSSLSSLTRIVPVLSLLVVAATLFAGQLATVQHTAATTALTEEQEEIIETQDTAIENLSESDRDVNGIEFTPRWGAVSTIEPNTLGVLFADCLENEFAVSSVFVFETSDIIASESFPVALPQDSMTWLTVVENTDTDNARAASIGVICAEENDGDDDDVDIDNSIKTTIRNTVQQLVQIQNNQIVNLRNVVNIYQAITQNAYQIAQITGNNNTVNQVIRQSAEQILSANTTNPTDVQQIIDQTAEQQGVISGGGTLSQGIDQGATQAANVTGGDGTAVDQAIDQGAGQAANVTGGDGTAVDQAIDQGAGQAANVTGQAANVTGGDGTAVDQLIGQEAGQSAQVTDEEEE